MSRPTGTNPAGALAKDSGANQEPGVPLATSGIQGSKPTPPKRTADEPVPPPGPGGDPGVAPAFTREGLPESGAAVAASGPDSTARASKRRKVEAGSAGGPEAADSSGAGQGGGNGRLEGQPSVGATHAQQLLAQQQAQQQAQQPAPVVDPAAATSGQIQEPPGLVSSVAPSNAVPGGLVGTDNIATAASHDPPAAPATPMAAVATAPAAPAAAVDEAAVRRSGRARKASAKVRGEAFEDQQAEPETRGKADKRRSRKGKKGRSSSNKDSVYSWSVVFFFLLCLPARVVCV